MISGLRHIEQAIMPIKGGKFSALVFCLFSILPPPQFIWEMFLIALFFDEIVGVFVSLAVSGIFHEGGWGVAEVEWDA